MVERSQDPRHVWHRRGGHRHPGRVAPSSRPGTLDMPGPWERRLWCATFRNSQDREIAVRLTFIGKDPDSNTTGSPTVYRTDRETWIVQGWKDTDPDALTQQDMR